MEVIADWLDTALAENGMLGSGMMTEMHLSELQEEERKAVEAETHVSDLEEAVEAGDLNTDEDSGAGAVVEGRLQAFLFGWGPGSTVWEEVVEGLLKEQRVSCSKHCVMTFSKDVDPYLLGCQHHGGAFCAMRRLLMGIVRHALHNVGLMPGKS